MTTQSSNPQTETNHPARARPVLSTADFKLLRTAVHDYLLKVQDKPESIAYSNLYHRLGSVR